MIDLDSLPKKKRFYVYGKQPSLLILELDMSPHHYSYQAGPGSPSDWINAGSRTGFESIARPDPETSL